MLMNYQNVNYSPRRLIRQLEREHQKYRKIITEEVYDKKGIPVEFNYLILKDKNFSIKEIILCITDKSRFCVFLKGGNKGKDFHIEQVDLEIFRQHIIDSFDKTNK